MPHKGLNHKIAQKLFNRPKITRVKVKGLGNTVWESINGENTIADIGKILENKHGDEAKPVYERLSLYLDGLEKNKFIRY